MEEAVSKKADSAIKRMENQLETICKKERKDPPEYVNNVEQLVVHYGKIAEEIVEKANMWGCESIVLGPHKSCIHKSKSISFGSCWGFVGLLNNASTR